MDSNTILTTNKLDVEVDTTSFTSTFIVEKESR